MRRKIFVLLTVSAVMAMALAGCTQTAQDCAAENGMPETGMTRNGAAQTDESSCGQSAEEGGKDMAASSTEQSKEEQESSENTVPADSDVSVVYMTTDISADGLMAVYEALGASPEGNIAVKLSTGEPGSNYLRTDLIGDLVQSLDATIVECNTAYGGSRSNTAMHYQVAEDHGYTEIADVDIMDENGSMTLPVTGGSNLTENYVGADFADYDYFVVLSHFKGHAMAGFGGAIKISAVPAVYYGIFLCSGNHCEQYRIAAE